MNARPRTDLTESQRLELTRTLDLLELCAKRGVDAGADWSNVLGLIGRRGAGKSTLLRALSSLLDGSESADAGLAPRAKELRRQGIWVVPSLDCSALPDQVEPATAVLMRICSQDKLWSPARLGSVDAARERHLNEIRARLRELAGAHVKGDPSYRELCQELSTAPDEFPQYLIEGVRARFDLQHDIERTLDDLRQTGDVKLLVVGLDDFDLISGGMIRKWIQALLDTLHQPLLAFVLTADVHRLEYISLDTANEIDDETGQALLVKLLPPRNRIELAPFHAAAWQDFKPAWVEGDESKSLSILLDGYKDAARPWLMPLVEALVPRVPRGLVNLHEVLTTMEKASIDRTLDALLPQLATCRAEALLARRVADASGDTWLNDLLAKQRRSTRPADATRARSRNGVLVETWAQMVTAAIECTSNASPKPDLAPVRLLAPPLRRRRGRGEPNLTHDPRWAYPLRHDHYLVDPLRDAHDDQGRSFWAELLIERTLQEPRNRGYLLTRWSPLRERSEQACFELELPKRDLAAMFEEPAFTRSMLPWLTWKVEGPVTEPDTLVVRIGWYPLLTHLRRAASAWPAALLRELCVGPQQLRGRMELTRPRQQLLLLPAHVRSLILLVDALTHCPWEALSTPRLGWRPLTYLRLAAALVRAAYVDALRRAGGEDVFAAESAPQASLRSGFGQLIAAQLDAMRPLQQLEPGFAGTEEDDDGGSLRESDVHAMLARLDDAVLRGALDSYRETAAPSVWPLIDAARAYLDLPAYQALATPSRA